MRNMTYDNFSWKNFWSILTGIALATVFFLVSFVLPAYVEYKMQPETGIKDMYATYMIYTLISAILFSVAIKLNLWRSNKHTFGRDALAVAIGLNCILWGFMFIGMLPLVFPKG